MAISAAATPSGAWLVCRTATRACALPLADVRETMRLLALDPIAGAPKGVLGISRIRGEVVPIIHLGALLEEPQTHPRHLVTITLGERMVALAVDEVVGVRDIAETALRPLPPVIGGAAGDVLMAIGTRDRELLLFLETARLVSHSALATLHVDPA